MSDSNLACRVRSSSEDVGWTLVGSVSPETRPLGLECSLSCFWPCTLPSAMLAVGRNRMLVGCARVCWWPEDILADTLDRQWVDGHAAAGTALMVKSGCATFAERWVGRFVSQSATSSSSPFADSRSANSAQSFSALLWQRIPLWRVFRSVLHAPGTQAWDVLVTGGGVRWQDNKADVIDKYMPDEVRALKTAGELPETVKLNETEEGGEDNFEFGSGGEEVRTRSACSQSRLKGSGWRCMPSGFRDCQRRAHRNPPQRHDDLCLSVRRL